MGMTPFQLEAWIEYAIGITILFSRIIYRTKLVGRNWAGDDYFAVASVCFLTGETAMLQVIGEKKPALQNGSKRRVRGEGANHGHLQDNGDRLWA